MTDFRDHGARDHGGGLDAAMARYGGTRSQWIDLSTGINPVPYPISDISADAWSRLPDTGALQAFEDAARTAWSVPEGAEIVVAPGASALIARMPALLGRGSVCVHAPTYNEHEAAFDYADGWEVTPDPDAADTAVYVHPNNPTGRLYEADLIGAMRQTVVDESFCDVCPGESHVARAADGTVVILKSFGKFWGLAGLRLGAAICPPVLAEKMRRLLGPWPVSGPALELGARALRDHDWAEKTRVRLVEDAARLDQLMTGAGAKVVGGTSLFRLYEVEDAGVWQDDLASAHIWTRIFPYSDRWIRLGLPAPDQRDQLATALNRISGARA